MPWRVRACLSPSPAPRGEARKHVVPSARTACAARFSRGALYHSLMLVVDLRDRSNMNRIAASLQTSGSMLRNSRCPPRSQMEKRTRSLPRWILTKLAQRLDVVSSAPLTAPSTGFHDRWSPRPTSRRQPPRRVAGGSPLLRVVHDVVAAAADVIHRPCHRGQPFAAHALDQRTVRQAGARRRVEVSPTYAPWAPGVGIGQPVAGMHSRRRARPCDVVGWRHRPTLWRTRARASRSSPTSERRAGRRARRAGDRVRPAARRDQVRSEAHAPALRPRRVL